LNALLNYKLLWCWVLQKDIMVVMVKIYAQARMEGKALLRPQNWGGLIKQILQPDNATLLAST